MSDTTTTTPRWFLPATWLEGIYGPRAHAKANGAEQYLCGSPLPAHHDWLTDELAAHTTPIRCGTCKRIADMRARREVAGDE